MTQNTSLEDEKRALLEQIHSSRETYRRMLMQSDKPSENAIEGNVVNGSRTDQFPRSMTMRWIVRHPYMSAAAGTAVALLGTRTAKTTIAHRSGRSNRHAPSHTAYMRPEVSQVTGTRRTARTRSTDFPVNGNTPRPMVIARSVFTGLATAAAMILRDPRKMRAATNAFSAVAGFVQSRRSRRSNRHHVQVARIK
jgi:hypothetical protein